jgi:pSer/pThr/pTyr-binding forkhead associated (FHA) protein
MILSLSVNSGPDRGASYPIPDELVIGRSAGADIVLRDEAVSRRHASVRPEGVTLIVEDLGSANGTWCNGEQIDAPCRLEEGDLIQLGDTELRVGVESGEARSPDSTPSDPTVIRPPQAS